MKRFLVKNFIDIFSKSRGHYSSSDRLFFYVNYFLIVVSSISVITNELLNLTDDLRSITYAGILFPVILHWLAHFKKKMILAQNLMLIAVLSITDALWFMTEGSSGTTLLIIQAFIPLFIFFNKSKYTYLTTLLFFINILVLFTFELHAPELLQHYPSSTAKSYDILAITIIFFIFEIPLIVFVKKELDKERIEAKESDKNKTLLISNLSHEIRTPMNAILGFTELLEDPDIDREYIAEYVGIINKNGRTLLNLLNNILNFSKLENDDHSVTYSVFNPKETLKQVGEIFDKLLLEKTNVSFVVDLPEEDIKLNSDPLYVYQVLSNLLYNAIKFTSEGFIALGYRVDNKNIIFHVKDSGIGIPKSLHKQIFEQFKQDTNSTLKINPNGAGLGLSICRKLTQILKGEIWVESEVGVGSAFYCRIPLNRPLSNKTEVCNKQNTSNSNKKVS